MASLNKFLKVRKLLVNYKRFVYTKIWGMDLHPTCSFSLSVKFDRTNPKGVHVGARSYIAFDVAILSHDMTRGLYLDTRIGENCFIGARSIILPGITIGDGCIVGSGSVVTKDVPSGCIVAGNPAKVIRENVEVLPWGRLPEAEENKKKHLAGG